MTAPAIERRLLTGWGGTSPTSAWLARAEDPGDVLMLLDRADGRGLIARGLGRSYGDAAQCAGGLVVDCTKLSGIQSIDADRGVLRSGAGTSLDALLTRIVPEGWFLPVVPGTASVTLGGMIASDVHGKNHHRDGAFCEHVLSCVVRTPAGETLTLGPDRSPELFWATAGGMGLTGVILEAEIRISPIETDRMVVVTERCSDLDDVMSRMSAGDDAYQYSVAWVDLMALGKRLGRSILTRANHALADQLSPAQRAQPLSYRPHSALRVPSMRYGLINKATVRAFNEMWFRKAPRQRTGKLQSLPSFFFPLDGLRDWPRLYGASGLLQYQLVVPFGAEETLLRIVERLASSRFPASLAVLKRFGRRSPGPLSFPIPGWTLAADLPAGVSDLIELLDGLDVAVTDAGGRVYLAKDARLRPHILPAMYPRLIEWQETRWKVDPQGVLRSDLARRVGLLEDVPRG